MFEIFAVLFACALVAALVVGVELQHTQAALSRARAEIMLLQNVIGNRALAHREDLSVREASTLADRLKLFDPERTAEEEIDPTVYDERRQPDPNKPISKGRYFQ